MQERDTRSTNERYRGSDFAFTADELRPRDSARAAPLRPAPFNPRREKRTYVDLNGEPLTVMFDRDALVFWLGFRGASALLDLTEARHIAAVLTDTLDDWRKGPHGSSGAGATATPEDDDGEHH